MSADDPIALCLAGRISPEVALARLALAGMSVEQIAARLAGLQLRADALPQPRHSRESGNPAAAWTPAFAGVTKKGAAPPSSVVLATLRSLLAENRDGLDRLTRMATESGLDHAPAPAAPDDALALLRASFDRAVACSPEAAVAAYSLGQRTILDAATGEIVDWLTAEHLIGPECDVLDLGCGIGRVAAALAPRCRSVLGSDLSPGMIAEARRRHAAPNLRFEVTDGRDLAALPDGGFDLVLAVDTFPYLMQAGSAVAERHVADAARLLRPGCHLAILNLSYGRGIDLDLADVARWAGYFGFELTRRGITPFRLWDGSAFVLRRCDAIR